MRRLLRQLAHRLFRELGLSASSARVDYSALLDDAAHPHDSYGPNKRSGRGKSNYEGNKDDEEAKEEEDDENVVGGAVTLIDKAAISGSTASRFGAAACVAAAACLPLSDAPLGPVEATRYVLHNGLAEREARGTPVVLCLCYLKCWRKDPTTQYSPDALANLFVCSMLIEVLKSAG